VLYAVVLFGFYRGGGPLPSARIGGQSRICYTERRKQRGMEGAGIAGRGEGLVEVKQDDNKKVWDSSKKSYTRPDQSIT
jgi:hypothetical protein